MITAGVRTLWKFRKNQSCTMNYVKKICAKAFDSVGEGDHITVSDYPVAPKVVAFGNVLLDHTAHLKNTELLQRYKLSLNSRGEMDVETLSKVTTEALGTGEEKEPHLGGAALNMVRIIKQLGTEPLFFGAVGADKEADHVHELLNKAGLNSSQYRLQTIPDISTGRCICLIYEHSLALYANIGASSKFSNEFLMKVECEEPNVFLRPLERKQIFYIEGFFVPQREDVITYIVRNYIKDRHYLALNLSANYIVKLNYHHMVYLAHHALFIFGNVDEFEMFRECWGASTLEDLAKGLVQDGALAKVLIITNGAQGVKIITNFVKEQQPPPPSELLIQCFQAAPVEKVIDTTGCGDAFAAAFIHSWLQKRSLEECARFASEVAAKVAGQVGCNLP